MKRTLIAMLALLTVPAMSLADAGDTRVLEMYHCALKEGKTAEEVAAHNAKWLAFVRKTDAGINSYGLQPIVGESNSFMFADTYPNLAVWGAAKDSLNSDEGSALEEGFSQLLDCKHNRLFKSTEH